MTTLNDAIEQDFTYIGRWAVHLETNEQVIIINVFEHDIAHDATVLVPGGEGLKTVPAGDLRLIPSSVWNDEGVPQRFAYWESTLDVENFPELEDIPQRILRKYAKELGGCWVEQLGLYYLVLKYRQGAIGDYLMTLNPITSAIKYIDIEDEVRLLPLEFREWGENTPEFLDMLERCTPQPEDETTKPEEVETDTDEEPDTEDAINPGHYRGLSNSTEVIDITENLTFAAGNVVKYVVRATRIDGVIKNNPVQDLEKARWYLDREIQRLKNT